MTISQKSTIRTPEKNARLTRALKAYIRSRTQYRIHSLVLELFVQSKLKQSELARMADVSPADLNRMLARPGNHTLNRLSDILFALGAELSDEIVRPLEEPARNAGEPAWLNPPSTEKLAPLKAKVGPIKPKAATTNQPKVELEYAY